MVCDQLSEIDSSIYKISFVNRIRTFELSIFDSTKIPIMRTRYLFLLMVGLACLTISCTTNQNSDPPAEEWKTVLENDLHLLGHRNWILVVDKAFPEQSSPGMKYLYVEEELMPVLDYVLERVEASSHVSPVIYRDLELSYITEEQVAGINAFRAESKTVLENREVNTLLHDEVFKMLDESASLFKVLVIKTRCTLPYTSVFLQLDCAYWTPENESLLREKISSDTPTITNEDEHPE
jgi:hypothetical protein